MNAKEAREVAAESMRKIDNKLTVKQIRKLKWLVAKAASRGERDIRYTTRKGLTNATHNYFRDHGFRVEANYYPSSMGSYWAVNISW